MPLIMNLNTDFRSEVSFTGFEKFYIENKVLNFDHINFIEISYSATIILYSTVFTLSFAPQQSFTYNFVASEVGTRWYHGHGSGLKMDGLFGAIIVHPRHGSLIP